jgi:hypothetical protein
VSIDRDVMRNRKDRLRPQAHISNDAGRWTATWRAQTARSAYHGAPKSGSRFAMKASAEIRDTIAGWFRAAADGDASWRDRHVSAEPDLQMIGTDPEEWLKGQSAYDFLANVRSAGGSVSKFSKSRVSRRAR